jgi:hypothetical protein
MGRAEQESTARIKRETLTGLLETMAPTDQQRITARVRISDIQAEAAGSEVTKVVDVSAILEAMKVAEAAKGPDAPQLLKVIEDPRHAPVAKMAPVERLLAELKAIAEAEPLTRVSRLLAELEAIAATKPRSVLRDARLFDDVDWEEILGAAMTAMVTPSLLQPIEPALALVIPDVREKLEACDASSFPTLSAQVAAELTGEEIAMLPMEIRLKLPETHPFPRIAMTPLPSDLSVALHSTPIAIHSTPSKELGHEIRVTEPAESAPTTAWPVLTLVAYFTAACLAGFGAVYCLA